MPKERIAYIDFMKGLCIMLIALGHVDDKIFDIDADGNVTKQGASIVVGEATIKITSKANSSISITRNVIIKASVTGITLNESDVEIEKGTVFQLVATIEPENATDKNVTWRSSNEEIATVDEEGNVTAKEAGNCN